MTDSIAAFIQQSQQRISQCLEQVLTQQASAYASTDHPQLSKLKEATAYSVQNGGKRLRPALVFAAAELANGHNTHDEDITLIAAAIECIHSYSLVHDDLPAMDDDDLRRGQPTCHIHYDEATAILVGDGLQALAFELITQTQHIDAAKQVQLIQQLAQAAGNFGMVGGQMIDLDAVGQTIDLANLENMHALKTGALIRASVAMGAITANATTEQLQHLDNYAQAIGLAFQIHDDILDIESSTEILGKPQGADSQLNKPTYPKLLGLDGAKEKRDALIQQAHQALNQCDADFLSLHALADFIIQRQH